MNFLGFRYADLIVFRCFENLFGGCHCFTGLLRSKLKCLMRHETHDPVRVHITNAEKRWEVPYDLLPGSQVAALEGSHISNIANPVIEFSVIAGYELILSCTANPFGFSLGEVRLH
ncbi:alpha-xylosidase 1-like isoform X2 [Cryptomeria japonica]|uniref:alpha-xylosidase 1-like isoform X2 n=1 Tax=Cryptomeria japonica TaxID=3369 RepID=UPI0027DA7E5E|nr:alpha-xylosidase 1-like isoform X2 [Cryptomeria japonica]